MAQNWIGEVVKEFVLSVPELNHSVKGRITKTRYPEHTYYDPEGKLKFEWQISHHCKPSEKAATAHFPDSTSGETLEETEQSLMAYMQVFTTFGVIPNKYY
jgi:hypothetical protein